MGVRVRLRLLMSLMAWETKIFYRLRGTGSLDSALGRFGLIL
jgi:hypothetical protein